MDKTAVLTNLMDASRSLAAVKLPIIQTELGLRAETLTLAEEHCYEKLHSILATIEKLYSDLGELRVSVQQS